MDIREYLEEKRGLIDAYLDSYFSHPFTPRLLHESMRYSLLAGGKRIRPILALASCEACGGDSTLILPQAAALELIHTYSLIHDDLPAMDNDDLRRGKPTNHRVFGEAMAILAGDALLTEAFVMMTNTGGDRGEGGTQIISGKAHRRVETPIRKRNIGIPRGVLVRAVREVAFAAGARGMVGGQAQDVLSENTEPDAETLTFIHSHKTAALIAASVKMGAILAGCGRRKLDAISRYGEKIGLAFQIVDDVLNVEGTARELGKPVGSDRKKRKVTFPALFGIETAKEQAASYAREAIEGLGVFSSEADPLREIARYLIVRRQ